MLTVSFSVKDETCIFIGGGAVAERRIGYLLREEAKVIVISPVVTKQIEEWALGGLLEWRKAPYTKGCLVPARLVFIMTDDVVSNTRCAEEAHSLGALVNRADARDACDFTMPAELLLGELHFTISTGKCSPRLNRLIREDMTKRYAPIEQVVQELSQLRADVKGIISSSKAREQFWQEHFTAEDLERILTGQWAMVEEKIKHAISSARR